MPRKDLTLKNKIAILNKIKNHPSNTSLRQLAEIINVPKSTISRLLKDEKQLHDEWMLHEEKPGTSKRKREGKDPDVEEALDQWFSVVTQRGVNISGPILKAKAEEFAKKLHHNDFKATSGWLSRWKTRRNIKFKTKSQELNCPGVSTIDSNLPCYDKNGDWEDAIIEGIKSKNHENLPVPITNQEAKQCIDRLQRYFMQDENEGSPILAINICADFVQLQSRKSFQKT